MVTIAIPSYKQENTIGQAIKSARLQDYADKEILIIDDCSTDETRKILLAINALKEDEDHIRIIFNEQNLGIGKNLTKCMREAKGEYIVYLCSDDLFTDYSVVSDMVRIFERYPRVGVIGRHYYQFLDGHKGAINRVDSNILVSSCNPSGIGFRKSAMIGEFSDKIFLECPYMVKKVLSAGWGYQIMDYDTVAVRIKEGQNTATNSSYYTESPTQNWNTLIKGYVFYPGFISLKIRQPSILLKEMLITIKCKPLCLLSLKFWACVMLSCLPSEFLNDLSRVYRHNIQRRFCDIKPRSR